MRLKLFQAFSIHVYNFKKFAIKNSSLKKIEKEIEVFKD